MSPYNLDTPLEDLPFPVQRLTDEERDLWLLTYVDVFEQTGDVRKAEASAWGAVKRDTIMRDLGMKSVDGKTIIGGWSNLFTDEENLDLVGTYFDDKTEYALDYYQSAPLLYEHDAGYGIIGKRTHTEVFPHGIWMEHELHADSPIFDKIISELKRGVLYYSTDSISHVVEVGYEPEDNRLGLWFLAGCSLTQNPAEPGLGPVTFTGVVNAIKSAQGNRVDSADDATTSVNPNKQEVKNIMDLAQLAVMLGLAETATQDEVVARLQSLLDSASAEKMNGEYDEAEDKKNIAILEMISQAMEAETGTAPSPEELRALLASALESLGAEVEIEEEEPVLVTDAMASATKSFVGAMKGSLKPVTRYQGIAHNPQRHQTGVKQRGGGNGGRGFGTPIAKKSAKAILAEGIVHMAEDNTRALKAMGYQEGAVGGWLANREVADELLALFYANTAVIQAGATMYPMGNAESMVVPRMVTGATAYWAADGQASADSNPTFGFIELQLREAIAETLIPKRLIKNSSADIENIVINELEQRIRLLVDLSALRGSGAKPSGSTGRELLGVLNTPNVNSTNLATNGKVPGPKDFTDAWYRLHQDNVPPSETWGVIMNPRTEQVIKNTTDTTGQLIPVERFTQGHGMYTTTQIPINLTVGNTSDNSEVYFGDWRYLYMGVGQNIEFVVDTSRYVRERQILIQAVMYVDAVPAYPQAFEVLTGVRG